MKKEHIPDYILCRRCGKLFIPESDKICMRCELELTRFNSSSSKYYEAIANASSSLPQEKYLDKQYYVYFHKSIRTTCLQKNHRVELRNVIFPYNAELGATQKAIVADYCYDCDQYQVSNIRLKEMELKRNNVICKLPFKSGSYNDWKDTPLAQWGYTANENVTDTWRQNKLSFLIENPAIPEITPETATRDLEKVVSMNADMQPERMANAIQRRLRDLDFIHKKYIKNNPTPTTLVHKKIES